MATVLTRSDSTDGEEEMFRRIVSTLAMLALPSSAIAACGGGGCTNVRITKLYVNAQSVLYVDTDGKLDSNGIPIPMDCTRAGGVYLTLNVPAPSDTYFGQYQSIYSLLLSSFLQKRPVEIRIVNGSTGCIIAYVTAEN